MIFNIDTYQESALQVIENNDVSFISGQKSAGKSFLIRYIARKLWEESKNCIIIVPDFETGELMHKHLAAFGIQKYSLFLNENPESLKSNASAINNLIKEEKIQISKKDIDKQILLFQNSKSRIESYYKALNQTLVQGRSLNELLTISAFDSSSYTNIHFNQILNIDKFDFSETEFSEISSKIKIAFELSVKGENKTDSYFSKKSYIDANHEKSWALIMQWLENSRIKVLKSIEWLSIFLNEQINSIFSNELKSLQEIITLAENCLFECRSFSIQFQDFQPKSQGIFGLDKISKEKQDKYQLEKQKIVYEYKKIITTLGTKEHLKNEIVFPDPEWDQIDIIITALEKIIENQESYETVLYNSIKKDLKSANFRNIRNEYTENLQNELKSMFSYLNDGYSVKKWEDTAFSFNKQLNYLESILEDFNEFEAQKTDFFKNYQWNTFLHGIDEKSAYLIKKFIIYRPKNWLIFLRNWYIQNLISKFRKNLNFNVDLHLNEIKLHKQNKEEFAYLKYAKIWQNKREIYFNKTEDVKSEPIRKIISDKQLSLDEIGNGIKPLVSEIAPVMIITADTFQKIKENISETFDFMIFSNCDEFKDKLTYLIPEKYSGKLAFFAENENLSEPIKDILWKKNIQSHIGHQALKGYHQQGMILLTDMNTTERLYAARNISFMLQSTVPDLKIYQTKNKILFSAFDEVLNKVLIKLLDNQGIKEMKIIDTPFHLLVDCILEVNTKQVLIIQNNLLNFRKTDNIFWQFFVMDKIRKSGIKIINFNSASLMHDPVRTMKEFIRNI